MMPPSNHGVKLRGARHLYPRGIGQGHGVAGGGTQDPWGRVLSSVRRTARSGTAGGATRLPPHSWAKFARLAPGQDESRSKTSSIQGIPRDFCGISRFGKGLFGRPELASEQPKQLWAHEDLNLGPLPCQGMNDKPSTSTNAA